MTASPKSVAFDAIYQDVPADQRDRLLRFRATHPPQHLDLAKVRWEYLSGGRTGECLVILGGASGIGELAFRQLLAFEDRYRVLVPSYPAVGSMAELVAGIHGILSAERIGRVHLLGGSFGGLVAQCFVRRHPEQVASLILSHTGLPQAGRAAKLSLLLKILPLIPASWLRLALGREASKLLPSDHSDFAFWRAYFQDAFAGLSRRDIRARYRCMVDLDRNYSFSGSELADWPGSILILEADDDPVVPEPQRRAVRALYPRAQVYTFRGTGHASALVVPEAYGGVVLGFLRSASAG
jgi:pimeloyl-ACP methyl ester carboxylesterase